MFDGKKAAVYKIFIIKEHKYPINEEEILSLSIKTLKKRFCFVHFKSRGGRF